MTLALKSGHLSYMHARENLPQPIQGFVIIVCASSFEQRSYSYVYTIFALAVGSLLGTPAITFL